MIGKTINVRIDKHSQKSTIKDLIYNRIKHLTIRQTLDMAFILVQLISRM